MPPLATTKLGFRQRLPAGASAGFQSALAMLAATWMLAGAPLAQACGYHDPASASVGMLNWAYPDALHVRTAVWMAQASGLLAAREPAPDADPLSVTFRFQQSIRLRNAQARLEDLRGRVQAALDGQPMPAFAVVLIGPMLWARFEANDGGVTMVPHATGPAPGDVVLVSDEPVVAALTEGRTTTREARAQGLVKAYGTGENVDQVSALLDRAFGLKKH
jgi:hypothetical protein